MSNRLFEVEDFVNRSRPTYKTSSSDAAMQSFLILIVSFSEVVINYREES
jgi:hypothetical protein